MTNPDLEHFIDEGVRRSSAAGYHPTIFIGMRQRHGTVEAISRLVVSGDIQSGFRKLNDLGLLDWTVEAAVTKFSSEFSRSVLVAAEWRLKQAGRGVGEGKSP